jgi:hypothetical protein
MRGIVESVVERNNTIMLRSFPEGNPTASGLVFNPVRFPLQLEVTVQDIAEDSYRVEGRPSSR